MRYNNNNIDELVQLFLSEPRESELWDVKQEWHDNSAELIKDIVCFANTVHDENCYLIFGVNDEHKVCGMQKKRYKQSDILDTLSNLQFAGDIIPQIELKTISMQSSYAPYDVVDVDVLIVYNTDMTPIFLKKPYGKMLQGCIYSRIGDKNTPDCGNSDITQIEMLWRKRLGLTKPPFEYIIDSLSRKLDWQEYNGAWYNIYKPEYVLKNDWDNDNDSDKDEFYSYSQVNESTHFYMLSIIANNTVLKEYQTVCLDGGRLLIPVPEWGTIGDFCSDEKLFYKYYIEGSTTYKILDFLYNPQNSDEKYAFMHLSDVVLFYKSNEEKIDFEDYIYQGLPECKKRIEACKDYEYVDTGCEARTKLYKQRLRIALVLNKMLEEFRNQNE